MRQRLGELGMPMPKWSDDPASSCRGRTSRRRSAAGTTAGASGSSARATRCPTSTSSSRSGCRSSTSSRSRSRGRRRARRSAGRSCETVQRDGICVEVVAPAPRLSHSAGRRGAGASRYGSPTSSVSSAYLRWSCSRRRAGCSSTSSRCARTTPVTGRSRASTTSQFEQHLRAVLDWPLGDTRPRAPFTVMANLLGGAVHRPGEVLPAALAAVAELLGAPLRQGGASRPQARPCDRAR